ncbi:MAG: isochorismatase family protein [Mangrovibacterium sp.]
MIDTRKTLLILTLILNISLAIGQTESARHKKVADLFEAFYNSEKYDSIFALFSNEMANYLPKDKTMEFLSGLNAQAGKIQERQFMNYQSTAAIYKTKFERARMIVNISVDANAKINGLFIRPFTDGDFPELQRNTTKLILPFNDEWTVVWGGDTKALNYHVENRAQKNAIDFVVTDASGKSYRTDGLTNDDYYAFGKDIIAPCAGEVVLVVDGVKDNRPGVMNPVYVPGNTVILKTDKNEFLFFAHFQQHSIKVKQGQKVKQGEVLGLCGNSGNSSEPHLHFHIQNAEDMNGATGAKCFFDSILVNGQAKTDYSPLRNEKVKTTTKQMIQKMKKALIIIDIQNDYFETGTMPLVGADKACRNAKLILDRFRTEQLPVIFIQHLAPRPDATFFLPNTKGAEIHETIAPLKSEKVIVKHYPNSFRDTDLLKSLQENQISDLVICGMMTHMCVDATTRAAKDLGFNVIVIGDACATKDLVYDEKTVTAANVQTSFLSALNYFYSTVQTTEQYLKNAGTQPGIAKKH